MTRHAYLFIYNDDAGAREEIIQAGAAHEYGRGRLPGDVAEEKRKPSFTSSLLVGRGRGVPRVDGRRVGLGNSEQSRHPGWITSA